jgi:hypothetical protein
MNDTRLRVYISGPISGLPEANYSEFADAAHLVQSAGCDPVIPHDVTPKHEGACVPDGRREPSGHTYACHLRADVLAMLSCDAVVMLPGWEPSHGARIEHTVAAACGLPIHYIGEFGSIKTSSGSHLFEAAREVAGV